MSEADALEASLHHANTDNALVPTAEPVSPRRSSLGRDAWYSLRHTWTFWVGIVLVTIFVVLAVVPGLFTSIDPTDCQAIRARISPSSQAWFGYDVQGCDIYARTLYGARASLVVGFLASFAALLVGGVIGVYAGFYGGLVDTLLSRITDVFYGIPVLLGSILVLIAVPAPAGVAFFSMLKVALAIAVLGWTGTARVSRSAVIQVKAADYVQAARALGGSNTWIIRKHVLPNAAAPVIVLTTLNLGLFIAAEAALSYLGLGLQPPVISWGIAINDAASYVRSTPHMLFFPSLFLSLMVLSFILVGDSVREALDPKQQQTATKGLAGSAVVAPLDGGDGDGGHGHGHGHGHFDGGGDGE